MITIKYYEKGHNITIDDGYKEKVMRLRDEDLPISTNLDESGLFKIMNKDGVVVLQTNDTFTFARFPVLNKQDDGDDGLDWESSYSASGRNRR